MAYYIDSDKDGNDIVIPIPKDWVVEVKRGEWEAWAHSKDYEQGVMETGSTRDEAVKKLYKRMTDWLGK